MDPDRKANPDRKAKFHSKEYCEKLTLYKADIKYE